MEDADVEDDNEDAPLLALPAPPPPKSVAQKDAEHMQRLVTSMMRGIRHSSATMVYRTTIRNKEFAVHVDNCSHSSGKQRAYVACPVAHHAACFKYSIVERFPNVEKCACWLAAWARGAVDKDKKFTKEKHKTFQPLEFDIEAAQEALTVDD